MEPNQLQVFWPDNSGDIITLDFQRIGEKIVRVYSDPISRTATAPRTYNLRFIGLGVDDDNVPDSEVTFVIKQNLDSTVEILDL